MKTFLRKTTSALLALALTLSLTALPALASDALGEDLTAQDTLVHRSTVLSSNVFWSTAYSDLRTENLVTYTPSAAVTPMVAFGETLTACSTVSAAAKQLESQGYRVVAGVNGDFYNTSTGLPVGLVVSGGEVKTSDGGYYAVGFHADGTAVLGKPALKVSADLGYTGYDAAGYGTEVIRSVTGINKARVSTGGVYLYTYEFNSRHTTGNTEPGVDVVCTIQSGSLSVGGALTVTVASVVEASAATAIQPGQIVLSANALAGDYYTNALRGMTVGSTATISVTAADAAWNGVQSAVGALYALVQDGAVVSGLAAGAAPRTAVGQKADGTLVFYTIDGRQSGHSIGASLTQVAERLVELGCVSAVCLDGGGSTTLSVTEPDSTAAAAVNSPSGGSQRAVTNQLFLVASNQPSGVLDHFYVSADHPYVLAGSRVNISAAAVDTNYIPLTGYSHTLSASAGTLSGSELTTPATGGDVTVTASGGGRSGSTVVHAVATPDAITVENGSTPVKTLTMAPGGSLTLTASAVYNHLDLKADASAFTWSLSGDIGSVDAAGKLTAATPGTGTLTVSAGGKSASVAVTVSRVPLLTLEDFEGALPTAAGYSYGAALTVNAAAAYVQYGRLSGKLDYALASDGAADLVFDAPYAVSSPYTLLNFWVYGDGSGNTLSLLTTDGSTTRTTVLTALDFTGYRQLSAPLPAGTAAVTGMQITGRTEIAVDETGAETVTYPAASGTLYLDQLTASYNGVVDTAAPAVTAALNETALTASVTDGGDGVVALSGISVQLDGRAIPFTYDAKAGTVAAAVSVAPGAGHRVTVLAKDASGNIGRASVDIDSYDVEQQFTDIKDYWGGAYVNFLKTSGVTNGYADGTFHPNDSITRAQFAAMLFRYLGLEESRYADVALPFADTDQISDYALTAVKALYTIGIIGGTEKGGKLYFNPGASLTRAQAAAMIGRTQEKGYAVSASAFTDASAIPSYAAYYVSTMAAQGVIGGYADGSFRPNAQITRGQMAKILYNLL